MLRTSLREVLARRATLAPTATLYRPCDEPAFAMDTPLVVLIDDRSSPHFTRRLNTDDVYLFEVELLEGVLLALESALQRQPSEAEIVRAVAHYAEHDAFISREALSS